jgi:hypothetical protein
LYRFLSRRPDLEEINFWQPGGNREFRTLSPGESSGIAARSSIHEVSTRSSRLKTDFDNGKPYYPLSGHRTWLPSRDADQPGREFLEWHADTVYRG